MRKNTLLASVAALSLFGATTIASAQSMNQGSPKGAEPPAAAAPKGENTTPATPPAAKRPHKRRPPPQLLRVRSPARRRKIQRPCHSRLRTSQLQPPSRSLPQLLQPKASQARRAVLRHQEAQRLPLHLLPKSAVKSQPRSSRRRFQRLLTSTSTSRLEPAFRLLLPSIRFPPASSKFIRSGAAIRSSWLMADTSSSVRKRTKSSTSSKANLRSIWHKPRRFAGAFLCLP